MSSRGFTLIELIIAIFILSIGIVGIFGAYSAMIVATGDTSSRLTATYLAQEAMEKVTDMRNDNLVGTGWNTGLTGCTSGCEADYTTGISTPMTTWVSNGHYLLRDSNGFYNYITGTPTKFKRKITITCFSSADSTSVDLSGCSSADPEMKVSTTVYWDKKANLISSGGLAAVPNTGYGSMTVEEYLYNLQ